MKDKITFDSGIKQYEINGHSILRFNPSDPNVYKRFKDLLSYITSLEKEIETRTKELKNGLDYIDLLAEYDEKVKEKLKYVFGQENDFDTIFNSENIMALASNGEMIITNFLNGIRPIVEKGIKSYAKLEAKKAVAGNKE